MMRLSYRTDYFIIFYTLPINSDLYVKCSEPAGKQLGCRRWIRSSTKTLPRGEKNTAYRAARLFMEELQLSDVSIEIEIGKHIPSQAGLGGGSAARGGRPSPA